MNSLLQKLSVGMLAMLVSLLSLAEDIDIFVGGTTGSGGQPNVLIVLDNTSNWSRQSQQWEGGLAQGQSEARAVKTAMAGLVNKVNVGVMEFTTSGNPDGGFVRFDLQALDSTSLTSLNTTLQTIFDGVNDPIEKRSANTPYGNLMYDVYNYLAGRTQSYSSYLPGSDNGTPARLADARAYSTQYSRFRSPLDSQSACVKNYVIFIGNPNTNGPATDSASNTTALLEAYNQAASHLGLDSLAPDKLAGQASGTPLPIPLFTTTNTADVQDIGWTTGQCYSSASACTTAQSATGGLCDGLEGCACSSQTRKQGTSCTGNTQEYMVKVTNATTDVVETGASDTTKGANWNFDDWAKFLNQYGVPIRYVDDDGVEQVQYLPVVTYTIDVFNAQQNAEHTGLMLSAAKVGGGKYFAARNEESIVSAIQKTISEILSASTTFAAVALPLSATNRTQNENQVFIGMFRPDGAAAPRWFGNLKRYQISIINGQAELADEAMEPAVNPLTDFPTECAKSFWSEDSGNYWEDKGVTPPPLSNCLTASTSPWSDAPDGPYVEKGGAAQSLRNYSPAITSRNVLTVGSNGLVSFDSSFASAVGGLSVLNYIRGQETVTLSTTDEATGVTSTSTVTRARHDIHGDVVHSRPLPINYGVAEGSSTPTISVIYGTNDGLIRAVDAASGKERWSFVAPEHFSKLPRLQANSPLVAFPNQDMSASPTPKPKDYFFDGAVGSYLVYGSDRRLSTAYIFPSMRRGGRMVYAFNVIDPDAPELMWRKGCPQLDSDTGCDVGFSGIGQTWSMPKGARLKGYDNGESPVVIFGGGYDKCEDVDALTTSCTSSSKGHAIYVVDAVTGNLVKAINAVDMGGVVADISLVDLDYDGYTDLAYAVDLKGNVWRVNFSDPSSLSVAIDSESWTPVRIAYTSNGGRKFLNAPSVLPYDGKVYLAFGSGNRERPLTSNYPYQLDVDDRYYMFLDYPTDNTAHNLDGASMHDYTAPTSCETAGVYPSSALDAKRGWFFSLPGQGEQTVTTSAIVGGVVAFNTHRAGRAQVGMCTVPSGIAESYQVSLFNASGAIGVSGTCGGERSISIPGGGMPISPTIGTVTALKPDCTGNDCEEVVTFCIGCQGLSPLEIEPRIDQVRTRTYWGSDIDR